MGKYKFSQTGPQIQAILDTFKNFDFTHYNRLEQWLVTLNTPQTIGLNAEKTFECLTHFNNVASFNDGIQLYNTLVAGGSNFGQFVLSGSNKNSYVQFPETGTYKTLALIDDITTALTNYVTTNTEQDISGYKTFTNSAGIKIGAMQLRNSNNELALYSSNNSNGNNKLRIGTGLYQQGTTTIYDIGVIACQENDLGGINAYLQLPARGTSSNPETLACLSDIPDDSTLVHTTGSETITGNKAFDGLTNFYNMAYFYDGYSLGNHTNIFDGGIAGVINVQYGGDVYADSYLRIPNVGTRNNPATLATLDDIPSAPTNYVTTDTDQLITVDKYFQNCLKVGENYGPSYTIKAFRDGDIHFQQSSSTEECCLYLENSGSLLNNGTGARINFSARSSSSTAPYASMFIDVGNGTARQRSYINFPLNKGASGNHDTFACLSDCGTKIYKHTLTVYTSGPQLIIISLKSTPYSDWNEIALNRNSSVSFLDCYAGGIGHIECIVLANNVAYLYGYEFINNVPTLGSLFASSQYLAEIQDTVTPL